MVEPKSKEEKTAQTPPEPSPAAEGRQERLEKIAKHHILTSMGVGLVPLPFFDMAAITGVQLNMIRKVAAEYDVPFKKDAGKSIILSLMGGTLPVTFGCTIASIVKVVPLVGHTAGAVTMPVIAGASTYAIYKVFVQHFESGGTFLDLDPSRVKSYFAEQFSKGKKVAKDLKEEASAKAEA